MRSPLTPALRRLGPTFLLLVAVVGVAPQARAQTETGRFVSVNGGDTLTHEEFTRTPTSLVGRFVRANGSVTTYNARLRPNGTIDRLEFVIGPKDGTLEGTPDGAPVTTSVQQRGDSIVIQQGSLTQVIAGRDVVPTLGFAFAFFEQGIRRGRTVGGPAASLGWMRIGQPSTVVNAVLTRPAADSAILTVNKTQVFQFRVDANGRILHGRNPENGVEVFRVK